MFRNKKERWHESVQKSQSHSSLVIMQEGVRILLNQLNSVLMMDKTTHDDFVF
jgi:hypothetical protein